ncbi:MULTISPECIES: MFS transporter [Paenibacillus]|uniref:MFS transporter n=1 Tax=Paenibacillus TaxID=44249 RepID=UPI002023DC7E|nr:MULTISPECIES: MFS transporter [Paenibacillus]MCP3810467.1 MFS transporter [Paenibacillus sp. Lou8.1]MDY8049280.1 MFS transporter [Paenibacillus polymyxa]URJ41829.3 MFS transporter [Paenibacillus polymyxa]
MKRLFALSCAFYLLIGITSVVLGALLPVLLPYYGLGYSDGGLLLFLQFFGFLVGVLFSPFMALHIGRKSMLSIALVSIVAGYAILGVLPSWTWVIVMTIWVGFGSGIIESSIGAFTIEFTEEQKAVAMSKLDVYFALGALLIPAVVSLYIWLGMWYLTFYTISLLTFILGLFWITMPTSSSSHLIQADLQTSERSVEQARYSVQHRVLLGIFIVFFFVYMGLELGLMNFLPSILIETLQIRESVASLGVSILWIAMIIGRMFSGKIAESAGYIPFLLWSGIGTFCFLVAMAFVSSQWATYLLIFGAGLFMSGLFCIALVYANVLIPGMTERTTSILIASGGIGGAVLQYVTGWSMSEWSVTATLWILAAFSLILLLAVIFSYLWNSRSRRVVDSLVHQGKEG